MKKTILAILIIIVFTGCTASQTADDYYDLGVEQFNQKEFTDSYNSFENAFQKDGNYYKAYVAASDVFLVKNDFERAKSVINKGLTDSTEGLDILTIKLAGIQYEMTSYELAMGNYNKLLADDAKNIDAIIGKVKTLIATQKIEEARSFLQENFIGFESSELSLLGLALFINDKEVSTGYLQALAKDEEYKTFTNNISANLELMYENEDNLLYAAEITKTFLESGYYVEAIPMSLYMLEVNPYYEIGLIYKSIGFINIGQLEITIDDLELAKKYNPELFDTHVYLAEVYYQTGDTQKSIDSIKSALKYVTSADGDSVKEILQFYNDHGEYSFAKDILIELETISPELLLEIDIQITHLIVETNLEKYASALEIGTELLVNLDKYTRQNQVKIYSYVGYVKFNLGDKSDGLDFIHQAQLIDNTYPESYLFEGLIYVDQNEYDKAKTALSKAVDLDITGRTKAISLYEELN